MTSGSLVVMGDADMTPTVLSRHRPAIPAGELCYPGTASLADAPCGIDAS